MSDLEVTFGHGTKSFKAVQGVSFTVPFGQSFGLVGESGSGKSTILRALSVLVRPSGGRLQVAGGPLPLHPPKTFRRRVQLVFQDPYASLHPRHSIDRILREPLEVHGFDRREERILQSLDEVGLPRRYRYRYPHQLSGGQRQRVAIARALVLEPEILLLDEPTSALDVSIQAEILNLLSDLREARQLTYLLVSHNLAVVAHMCDRVAIMSQGKIVEVTDSRHLRTGTFTHPYSQQLWASSQGYFRDPAVLDVG
nr:ABC transporter ATP-binding protein [Arboricoccus pini]